jgi:hypothetical protein
VFGYVSPLALFFLLQQLVLRTVLRIVRTGHKIYFGRPFGDQKVKWQKGHKQAGLVFETMSMVVVLVLKLQGVGKVKLGMGDWLGLKISGDKRSGDCK